MGAGGQWIVGTPHPTSPLKKGGGEKRRRFAFLPTPPPVQGGGRVGGPLRKCAGVSGGQRVAASYAGRPAIMRTAR